MVHIFDMPVGFLPPHVRDVHNVHSIVDRRCGVQHTRVQWNILRLLFDRFWSIACQGHRAVRVCYRMSLSHTRRCRMLTAEEEEEADGQVTGE